MKSWIRFHWGHSDIFWSGGYGCSRMVDMIYTIINITHDCIQSYILHMIAYTHTIFAHDIYNHTILHMLSYNYNIILTMLYNNITLTSI